MHIGTPEIVRVANGAEYRVPYRLGDGPEDTLWFRVPGEFADLLSPRADAALLALVAAASQVGGTLEVRGPVTDELAHALDHGYLALLRSVTPGARALRLETPHRLPPTARAAGVLTALSGGVDSFAVIADYFCADDVPAHLRVTHLCFSDVQSHYPHDVVADKRARLAPVAEGLGLPFIAVDSNLPDLFRARSLTPFQTNSPVNAAVAFLLQSGIGTLLLGTAVPWRIVDVSRSREIALVDAIALPMLSTAALHLVSAGGEYGRVDKYERILTVPGVETHLDVCVASRVGGNCSRCWKCLRTQAELELLGLLGRFDAVFERAAWEQRRTRYLRWVQAHAQQEIARELVAEAHRRGARWPRPYPFQRTRSRWGVTRWLRARRARASA